MKSIRVLLILMLVCSWKIAAQIKISETEKFAHLTKIYGFLKYYHPNVASGTVNIDQQFLARYQQLKNVSEAEEIANVFIQWLDELGTVPECTKCDEETGGFSKNLDLSWLQNQVPFGRELSEKLQFIAQNRHQGAHHFVTTEEVGKIKITNEPSYENLNAYPDEAHRLLGLCKYWNTIEYFYPYKYLMDRDWDLVLMNIIPKFQNAANVTEYQQAIKELVAQLNDTHAWIRFEKKIPKYIPVKVFHVEGKPVIAGFYNDSLAQLNKLKLGDIILKINEKEVASEVEKYIKYTSASNEKGKINSIYSQLFSGEEAQVTLTIIRNDQQLDITSKRYPFKDFKYWYNPKTVKWKSIDENIGYINGGNVNGKEISKLSKIFKEKKAVIIDLRSYPKAIISQLTRFINSESKEFYRIFSPELNYPGKFKFKKAMTANSGRRSFKGKIILLVNGESISRTEFTAMAVQSGENVVTVGNQTAGANGDVVVFEYLGGYPTAMSGNGIQYPDGTDMQRKGIQIDVEVLPTIQGLKEGRDEILEKAIEIAGQKK